MTKESIQILNKEVFPLFKVEIEDTVRVRDVDVEWLLDAEEHELIRKGHKSVLYVKEKYGDDWKVVYNDLPGNLISAHVEIEEIKQHYNYWKSIFVNNKPAMFIYENQVFKNPYVIFDQLCICGEPIEPEKYYTEEGQIKVNFFKSYVRSISENKVLLHARQLYLNGKIIFDEEQLKEYKHNLYFSDELKKVIIENYPEVIGYESDFESGSF